MKLEIITARMTEENTYIYYDDVSKEAVIIDPGATAKEITAFVKGQSLNAIAVLLTHGHYDHITAVNDLQLPVYAFEAEKDILENAEFNLSRNTRNISVIPSNFLKESDTMKVGSAMLKVVHTPGHTHGGVCFYDEKEKILFSGDTLFYENIGRCDLYSGDYDQMLKSLREKLFTLPEDTVVYPGHGVKTTIAHEIKNNPYASVS